MIILAQDKTAIYCMGDFDSVFMSDGGSGTIYFKHGETVRTLGEYQSRYQGQAVIMNLYNTFGISPRYAMPSIGEAKRLFPSII